MLKCLNFVYKLIAKTYTQTTKLLFNYFYQNQKSILATFQKHLVNCKLKRHWNLVLFFVCQGLFFLFHFISCCCCCKKESTSVLVWRSLKWKFTCLGAILSQAMSVFLQALLNTTTTTKTKTLIRGQTDAHSLPSYPIHWAYVTRGEKNSLNKLSTQFTSWHVQIF